MKKSERLAKEAAEAEAKKSKKTKGEKLAKKGKKEKAAAPAEPQAEPAKEPKAKKAEPVVSTIVAEVIAVTKCKARKEDETETKFLARLAKSADGLSDDDWKKLPEPAQKWINAALAALNEKQEVPVPGAEPKPAKKAEPEESTEEEEPKVKKGKKEKAAKEPKAKKEKTKRSRLPKARPSRYASLRKIIIRNPEATVDEIGELAEKAGLGLKRNTIVSGYQGTRANLAVLEEMGLLRPLSEAKPE